MTCANRSWSQKSSEPSRFCARFNRAKSLAFISIRHQVTIFTNMECLYLVIDAFSMRPFQGNPAAVVLINDDLSDETCQSIAAEFNLPETAFLQPLADDQFALRWFTPNREVPLCGHATLASAHALWQWSAALKDRAIRFVTRHSGELTCWRINDGRIAMDFPATRPEAAPLPPMASEVLAVSGPVTCVGTTAMNLMLVLPDELQVRACHPNLEILAGWHQTGVIVTAAAMTPGIDFVSRFFAPQSGIPEDPVTGSAHCALAVYWANRLGKSALTARQLSTRGGEIGVHLLGDRVELRGYATTTMAGKLLI
jgi:PhzF family phenazine biosynthesis protein